ncbi:thioredoxin, mitochondrial [Microcaecilia unicolor]|uniref:Thioredoxin, mitochondrial n=1 Tax=Microcaecilia unicolor TaxID=1415580 RepID=A0A6P7YID6_9AMPH|nr:thioredoxin, mitochondrial [Microcaecilia unicolor]XP_030062671.1 thioredoxin, mitochondrial [Microcaecilia unicolor]XP_030062679.1 thioredoxin, mitochondrial [Microcaecilia unicolor]XP_030062684.1 thioredoxin, mitochondrial [Microcaecilia unicolor]XP_030062691.1 thioredoxin, mitochondrial [Microcaecilia unicolor]XP_030062697.1 thioredoxin, mitochondrial [Microcaecilia unicolor]XP_030062703.1 thioredoxin, mitochondrial [Microcaecilia unicolor]XP_030062708.1 thioredoxin, mitochondrial [Mic
MAQRILLQRVLSPYLKSLSVSLQCHSSLLVVGLQALCRHSLPTSVARAAHLHAVRSFSSSPVCRVAFNVQDGEDFHKRVIKSETPVIVDFHAEWCGPCKILGPRLEKMVAKKQGKVLMAKVDIDNHTELAIQYEVSAVPTVIAVKKGDVVDKFVGVKDEDQLEAFLIKVIGP